MADRRTRRRVAGLLIAVILTVDTVVWATVCRRLDTSDQDAGLRVQHSPSHWSGWPIAAEITWPDAIVRTTDPSAPPLIWTVATLHLRLSALAPTQLAIIPTGAETLAIGAAPPIPFTAGSLRATIDLTQQASPRIDATALTIDALGLPIRIATAALVLPRDGWSADLAGIAIPNVAHHGRDGRAIHPDIETIQLDGHLTAPIQPMPTATDSARDWRVHDGHLQLDLRTLHWDALTASAQATITLDPALQPHADGTLTATGLPATPAQLAEAGLITPASATAAAGLLAILAAPSGGGPLTLPLLWQDGVLSIARFPLLRTAPFRWD